MVILQYTVGIYIFTIVTYSEFTSRSSDYVTSKALFVFNQAKPIIA